MRCVTLVALLFAASFSVARATCTLSNASGPALSYDPISHLQAVSVGRITVTCDSTSTGSYVISLDSGLHPTGRQGASRAMVGLSTGALLEYDMFLDPAFMDVWGDGTGGTGVATGAETAGTVNYSMYARIPPSENVPADTYSDTIIATISY